MTVKNLNHTPEGTKAILIHKPLNTNYPPTCKIFEKLLKTHKTFLAEGYTAQKHPKTPKNDPF